MATADGAADPSTAELRSLIPTAAVTGPSSSILRPPYPLNYSTAFPTGRFDSTRGLFLGSASTFATSVHPNLFSLSSHSLVYEYHPQEV